MALFKALYLLSLAVAVLAAPAETGNVTKRAAPQGIDVSGWQPNINWNTVKAAGVQFAYIKVTEGTGYRSSTFDSQYSGSYNVGLIRGGYHFALPDRSSGAVQANYFASSGGAWSGDGRTLPGALDIEYNPYGATCYGLSQSAMVNWIRDFSNTYRSRTGRYPTIYTTTDWWKTCTGNNNSFGSTNALWVARYASAIGEIPAGFPYATFWQYTSTDQFGDHDIFNGDEAGLRRYATS
ncbi:putative N,O-diacetyl muramidase [Coprinopsis sp. MPI-PUGE-AT-0042]|nr:putative N,O-diacetyl muramidase [Coprinopsis sp. MPI-PUGE-AT-0042]